MRFSKILLLVAACATVSACATKGYVNDSVAGLEGRHGARLDALDQKTGELDRQAAELDKTSREALDRAIAAGKVAEGKFVYDVVLSDDAVKFTSGGSELSAEGQDRLAAIASQLKSENKSVYLEIQGHTDATGDAAANEELGLARANAVRHFLYGQGVALNRMATISYGEDSPVADNSTSEGRAANRRVVIVVLK